MRNVDKIVELFQKHKGKTLLDVRGHTTAIISTGWPDKAATFTFDFKDEATGAIDAVVIETAARIEGKDDPTVEPCYEEADLCIVGVRNYMAADSGPDKDLARLQYAAMTGGDEPGRARPWPGKLPEPPSEQER